MIDYSVFSQSAAARGSIISGRVRRSATAFNFCIQGPNSPGYEASTWFGIVAPTNTPTDIIEKLNSLYIANTTFMTRQKTAVSAAAQRAYMSTKTAPSVDCKSFTPC